MTLNRLTKALMRFILKPLSFAPALLMMYIIFSFSAQDGAASANLSYKVSYKAVSIADRALDLELTDQQVARCIRKIHYYVRKLAHFTEYFLLAVTIAFPLYVYGIRGIWLVIQYFVSGRSCSARDVMIDGCGSLLGIVSVRIVGYIGRKTIFS